MKPLWPCSLGEGEHRRWDRGPGQHQPGRQPGRLHPSLGNLRHTPRHQVHHPHSHIGGYSGKLLNVAHSNCLRPLLSNGFSLILRRRFCCRCRPWSAACCPSPPRRCPWVRSPITTTMASWWTKTRRPSYRRTWGPPARWEKHPPGSVTLFFLFDKCLGNFF